MAFPIQVLAPLIQGAFGAQGASAQAQQSNENMIMNYEMQRKLAEEEYQRNLQSWNLQNAYNTPAAQMQRYADAGLNPHLIYGQGTPGNAQGVAQYQKPSVQVGFQRANMAPVVQNTLSTLMEVGLWSQQMEKSALENQYLRENINVRSELLGYQKDAAAVNVSKSMADHAARLTEYKHLYGADLQNPDAPYWMKKYPDDIAGLRGEQLRKLSAERQLKELGVEYYEPALIYKAVLGGALGMAGLLRKGRGTVSNVRRPKITETESIRRVGRTRTTKTERYQSR